MATTVYDVLKLALKLIDRPQAWSRHAFARDIAGKEVLTEDSSARQFSVCGAIERANMQLRGSGASLYGAAMEAVRLELVRRGCIQEKVHVDEWADLPSVSHTDVVSILTETMRRRIDTPAM